MKLDQSDYWNKVANDKIFHHEIDWVFLQKNIDKEFNILDYGCGYGRLVNQFIDKGFKKIIGVDSSEEMIRRALKTYKSLDIRHTQGNEIPFTNESFDLVLLFAVLTCIPLDEDQNTLIAEINRVLKPGGLFYVSDLLINSDSRNKKRYNEFEDGTYGVFKLDEGAIVRHHKIEYLEDIVFEKFSICYKNEFKVKTMNGNTSKAIQLIGRKKVNN